jgi:hypothetical protein
MTRAPFVQGKAQAFSHTAEIYDDHRLALRQSLMKQQYGIVPCGTGEMLLRIPDHRADQDVCTQVAAAQAALPGLFCRGSLRSVPGAKPSL